MDSELVPSMQWKSGMWYSTLLVVVVVILLVTSPAVVSLLGPLCYSYPV